MIFRPLTAQTFALEAVDKEPTPLLDSIRWITSKSGARVHTGSLYRGFVHSQYYGIHSQYCGLSVVRVYDQRPRLFKLSVLHALPQPAAAVTGYGWGAMGLASDPCPLSSANFR